MKGQWCDYNKDIFYQENTRCNGCEIYLCRDSNSQKTKNAVLQSVTSIPNKPFSPDALQTQAGVTYPIPPCTFPACRLAPIGAYVDGANDLADPKSQSQLLKYVCGVNPQGASIHQGTINTEQAADELVSRGSVRTNERDVASKPHCFRYVGLYQSSQGAEIDLSGADGKRNRTGRRQARWLGNPHMTGESEHNVGSNPTHPIPAVHYLPEGAGTIFNKLTPTPTPCAQLYYNNPRYIWD